MLHRILPAVLCPLLWIASAAAQDKADANMATLQKARELSTLHQAGTPQYRLQASFETYNYKGEPDGKGIVTEVYIREGLWQRRILYRDKHSAVTSVDGTQRTVSDPDFQTTFPLGHVIEDLFAPIPKQSSLEGYKFKSKALKTDAFSLNCVIGTPVHQAATDSPAQNETYCVDLDPAILRVIEGHHNVVFTFNRVVRFGAVYVPAEITMMEAGKMRAHIHVDAIVASNLSEKDIILPPADVGGAQQVDKTVIASHKISGATPRYPDEAKRQHISGTVVMHVMIDKEGHIRDMELISASSELLVDSAMEAVRTWTYTPYLVNGAPAEVDTNITTNYSFGG